MPYTRKTPIRQPRSEELALLRQLLDGPAKISSGPLGRCLKRGWCKAIPQIADDAEGGVNADTKGSVTKSHSTIYGLTSAGREALMAHLSL